MGGRLPVPVLSSRAGTQAWINVTDACMHGRGIWSQISGMRFNESESPRSANVRFDSHWRDLSALTHPKDQIQDKDHRLTSFWIQWVQFSTVAIRDSFSGHVLTAIAVSQGRRSVSDSSGSGLNMLVNSRFFCPAGMETCLMEGCNPE